MAEKLSLAFVGVAVLLAMLVPENTYEQHEALRGFVDSVALHFNVINEFSAASSFPGATRVVLVLMWSLVVPMALLLRLFPGVLRWREEDLRRLGILGRLVWFIFLAAFGWILPNVLTVEGGGRAEAWMRVGAGSRLALGIMAGTYCAAVAPVGQRGTLEKPQRGPPNERRTSAVSSLHARNRNPESSVGRGRLE